MCADQPSATQPAHASADEPIEPAVGPGDKDEFDAADPYEAVSKASSGADSSIYAHTYEHGRRYHAFKNSRYPIPNDDFEQNREDMKHSMMLELTDGALFYAPIGEEPEQILDIGTGTGQAYLAAFLWDAPRANNGYLGIWAIDVGDRYPNARVRGMDLSPIQPIWVPPNVDFLVDDCEAEWMIPNCDLVHFRYMTVILKNVPKVLQHTYRSLKPGGWVEFQEISAEPLCDDGTMTNDDPVKRVYELLEKAFAEFGMNSRLAPNMEPMLQEAGFENIHCIVRKVPIGVWARDKTLRLIGLYQKLAVHDVLPAFAGRPFEALGMSQVESQVTLALARNGMEDTSVHRYFNYYFWYAQKPT